MCKIKILHLLITYVIRYEKTGLMYTKYTHSYKTEYLHYCTSYLQSASCIRFCRNDCINLLKYHVSTKSYLILTFRNVVKFYVHIRPIFSYQVTYFYTCVIVFISIIDMVKISISAAANPIIGTPLIHN